MAAFGDASGRLRRYLANRPVLCLALLTPGIPEYLSGSSSPVGLVESPIVFGLFLLANLGLYTAGVLLIREARVRWRLGWASVLTLGIAYGLAEEGLALATLFNPHAGPVNPATAGHLAGVNWIWSSEILPFHALYSVALPIFLLERALPGLADRPLLTGRRLPLVVGAYGATVSVLGTALGLSVYWMGAPVLFGSLAAIAGLILLARAMPRDALAPRSGPPTASPARLYLLGAGLFGGLIVLPAFPAYLGAPLTLAVAVAPALAALAMAAFLRSVGTERSGPGRIAFAAGLLTPVLLFGLFFALRVPAGLPLVVAADAAALLFLRFLYRRAVGPPRADPPTPLFPVEVGAGAVR